MNNLQDFAPPNDGELTLCEVDGRIHSANFEYSTNITNYTNTIDRHPKIHITRDMLYPNKLMEDGKDLFLPVNVSFLKQITQIYYEHGFQEALQAVTNHSQFLIAQIARVLLKLLSAVNRVQIILNPSLSESSLIVINQVSQTRNWVKSPIRCVAWHLNITKIAVAAADDTVRIFTSDAGLVPILKCKQQKNITCMAWRPMSNSDIAVGCENGVIIWNVDPHSVVTRPSTNHAIILTRIEHKPVVNISWSPRGDVLASAAACDVKLLLWDVELDRTSSLKRAGTLGHNLLKWAPAGDKLFAATNSYAFRVWDCTSWKAERWNILCGHVQAACWSPCSRYLLFTTSEETVIYALSFTKCDVIFTNDVKYSPNEAVPLYDVTKVDIDGVVVGGVVRSMDWDLKGNHLAILFNDTNCVAVFTIVYEPVLQLSPGFLIAGNPLEVPNTINFQPNFEHGTCLTIGWSSGRLQYFPIVYTDYTNASPKMQKSHYGSYNYIGSPCNRSIFGP